MNFASAGKSTFVMVADGDFVQVCGSTFAYHLKEPYSITVKNIASGSCSDGAVLADFARVAYFRKFDNRIEFYDRGVNLILSGKEDPNAAKRPAPVPEQVQKK